MGVNTSLLLLIGIGYLGILFAVAFAAERLQASNKLLTHPLTYTLALGVYASGFAIYGITGLAADYGMGYFNYYFGLCIALFLTPILISPLHFVCKTYRLNSIADLLSFRYRSQAAGSLAALLSCLAIFPLTALQIEAIAESAKLINESITGNTSEFAREASGLIFCIFIAAFTLAFGSRSLNSSDNHRGMLAMLAMESAIKLLALLVTGAVAVFVVFGGYDGMLNHLHDNPSLMQQLQDRSADEGMRIMFATFFGMALSMPTIFHMLFAENPSIKNIRVASWGLPLFLFGMSLPVMPILWAANSTGFSGGDYAVFAISNHINSDLLALLIFIGGLSAASGAVVVTTLALASMSLNHLVLPWLQPRKPEIDVYRWLLRTRQLLIVAIILIGYLLYAMLPSGQPLSALMIITTTGCAQLAPGLLGVLYWPRGNRVGLYMGLATGTLLWVLWLLLPGIGVPTLAAFNLHPELAFSNEHEWFTAAALSLGANSLIFIIVSILTPASAEERSAAEACTIDDLNRPSRQRLNLASASELGERLTEALGETVAQQEFNRALTELGFTEDETRPYALRRLRDRIEINLSSLIGPSVARRIMDRALPFSASTLGEGEDINFIESRLEHYQTNLTGLAADLDGLRRYHRQTLENLPIGVCSLARDQEILMWNRSMAQISQIDSQTVLGSSLLGLPVAWADCLLAFSASSDSHWSHHQLETERGQLWLNLHKTKSQTEGREELLIVVEDITETQMLENKLTHQERLASIGRLAAGVAHEIGNPVTGIACLAQNLRFDTENPDSLETASQIIKQTQRITAIVQSLVNFAHSGREGPTEAWQSVNICHCVNEAIQLLGLDNEAKYVHFSNLCSATLEVQGDTQRLIQVFVNLLSNSRDASPEDATICIEAFRETNQENIHITVTDSGEGIDQALQERIFEPFFTTKDPGKGTGLGLALVYNIVSDLGGEIALESPVAELNNCGTRVHLLLPIAT
jgi:signal transduction histidine kinase/Na+/proline symporter